MAYTPEQTARLKQLLRRLVVFGNLDPLLNLLLADDLSKQLAALLDQEIAKVAAVKDALPEKRAEQDAKIAADELLLRETKEVTDAAVVAEPTPPVVP